MSRALPEQAAGVPRPRRGVADASQGRRRERETRGWHGPWVGKRTAEVACPTGPGPHGKPPLETTEAYKDELLGTNEPDKEESDAVWHGNVRNQCSEEPSLLEVSLTQVLASPAPNPQRQEALQC